MDAAGSLMHPCIDVLEFYSMALCQSKAAKKGEP